MAGFDGPDLLLLRRLNLGNDIAHHDLVQPLLVERQVRSVPGREGGSLVSAEPGVVAIGGGGVVPFGGREAVDARDCDPVKLCSIQAGYAIGAPL